MTGESRKVPAETGAINQMLTIRIHKNMGLVSNRSPHTASKATSFPVEACNYRLVRLVHVKFRPGPPNEHTNGHCLICRRDWGPGKCKILLICIPAGCIGHAPNRPTVGLAPEAAANDLPLRKQEASSSIPLRLRTSAQLCVLIKKVTHHCCRPFVADKII